MVESNEAQGTVLSQDPAAGTEVPQGTAVSLAVSAGPPQVQIPEVKDSSQARAVNDLENLGLVVQTQERTNSSVAAGNAVKTEPAAGETVPVGSDVLLIVSKGPKQVTVPDVVGLGKGAAETTIADAELAVGQTVIAKQPPVEPPLARTAWTVIAHSQFDLGNYPEAETAYYSLRSVTPVDDAEALDEVKERIASSIYKQGEAARDAGDLETAVTHFRRLGETVPGTKVCTVEPCWLAGRAA